MIISDYRKGTEFEITCVKKKNPNVISNQGNKMIYCKFEAIKEHCEIFGIKDPNDIITCKVTILDEDVDIEGLLVNKEYDENCVDYFGWITFEDNGTYRISMIYPNIKLYFMCFPYGPDKHRFWDFDVKDYENNIIHKKGDRRGMTVRLKIEEL